MNSNPDLIEWLKRLFEAGGQVVAGAAIVASYFRIWMWRKDHEEIVRDKDERIADLEAKVEELTGMLYNLVPSLQEALTNTVARGKR
jgi:hypothetical protein